MAWLKKEKVYFTYCEHLFHMTHSAVSTQKEEEEEEAAPAVGDIPIRFPIPGELPHSLVWPRGTSFVFSSSTSSLRLRLLELVLFPFSNLYFIYTVYYSRMMRGKMRQTLY